MKDRHIFVRSKDKSRYYFVDGKIGNTIYEFDGDMWHGNPSKYNPSDVNPKNGLTYKELYENTLQKRKDLMELGYDLIHIWESEFAEFKREFSLDLSAY